MRALSACALFSIVVSIQWWELFFLPFPRSRRRQKDAGKRRRREQGRNRSWVHWNQAKTYRFDCCWKCSEAGGAQIATANSGPGLLVSEEYAGKAPPNPKIVYIRSSLGKCTENGFSKFWGSGGGGLNWRWNKRGCLAIGNREQTSGPEKGVL